MKIRVEGNFHKSTSHRFAQIFIFIFRIDNYDIRSHHHGAENFELDGIAFSGAGFGEHDHVGVFHFEPVKKNQAVVVPVYAV